MLRPSCQNAERTVGDVCEDINFALPVPAPQDLDAVHPSDLDAAGDGIHRPPVSTILSRSEITSYATASL